MQSLDCGQLSWFLMVLILFYHSLCQVWLLHHHKSRERLIKRVSWFCWIRLVEEENYIPAALIIELKLTALDVQSGAWSKHQFAITAPNIHTMTHDETKTWFCFCVVPSVRLNSLLAETFLSWRWFSHWL